MPAMTGRGVHVGPSGSDVGAFWAVAVNPAAASGASVGAAAVAAWSVFASIVTIYALVISASAISSERRGGKKIRARPSTTAIIHAVKTPSQTSAVIATGERPPVSVRPF